MINQRKIFLIGFNKCGTTSFHQFFQNNGLKSLHWLNGEIAEKFYIRMEDSQDPFMDYQQATVFTDMIKITNNILLEPYKNFEYIFRWYPDSYFILNTRNIFDWIKSRIRHGVISRYCSVLGLPDEEAVRQYWMQEWYMHHANVLSFFAKSPKQLLVYDIDKHSPEKLTEFLSSD